MTRLDLRLRAVRLSDEEQVRSAHRDLLADDFDFAIGLRPETSWPEYVEQLDLFRRAAQLPEPWLPATFLLAVVGGELVGRTSIRHRLNDSLSQWAATIAGQRDPAVLAEMAKGRMRSKRLCCVVG